MKQPKPEIMAAISAAIQEYLLEEEAIMAAAAAPPVGPPAAVTFPNLWGLSGRQAAMQMRQLVQRRSFR
ncbi:MAG: hypothetical protein JRI59_09880 [Deltaproteobacteria bacterium]|nr:hypothetical protein [Deltaproteobacteria bacterium]